MSRFGKKSEAGSTGTILLISNSTWNVYNFRLPVIRALVSTGHPVIVLAPVDESVSLLNQEPGIQIIPLGHLDRDSTGLFQNLLLLAECWRHYRRIRPKLAIHFTIKPNIFGNLAAALCGVPSICVLTGLGYTFLHKGWLQWVTGKLYRLSFTFARTIVFENGEDRDLLVGRRIVSAAKTTVVPGCGVDVQYFSPNGTTPDPAQTVFTFIGRLLLDKGIMEFVQAAELIKTKWPAAAFWVVGGLDDDNPAHIDRATLLEWVQRGIIQYKGQASDVRPFIAQSDWIVLPSYREGLSRVLLEAMSMARPIITSDAAGCRETVDIGENGFLVPVGDAGALAEQMSKCCGISKQEAVRMGAKGREKVIREFENDLVGKHYLTIVQDITANITTQLNTFQ
jgi:glycosyltransferase involved in cell wall biosynthesis